MNIFAENESIIRILVETRLLPDIIKEALC
jgi:hypothetical protein